MVWTGSEAIVWGGSRMINSDPTMPEFELLTTGSRYDPDEDAWRPMSSAGAPEGRGGYVAVWTGSEMIIWGGVTSPDDVWVFHGSGGRYDPWSDTWTAMESDGAPTPRLPAAGVWTGTELLVWGGFSGNTEGDAIYWTDGALYDPSQDSWRPVTSVAAPEVGRGPAAVWTGSELIVWGGQRCPRILCDDGLVPYPQEGGRYDPKMDSWRPISGVGAPSGRGVISAVWTGTDMIVWGGVAWQGDEATPPLRDGALYDPDADIWTPMSCAGAPELLGRSLWTGTEMLIWGLPENAELDALGGRYDPSMDAWRMLPAEAAASRRGGWAAIWTGDQMVIWGGRSSLEGLDTGLRFMP